MIRGHFTVSPSPLSKLGLAVESLKNVLLERAIMHGNFKLSSGGHSTFYINCRKASMSYDGMVAIGNCIVNYVVANGLNVGVIAGPEAAGIPLVSAALMVGHPSSYRFNGCFVRKGIREHGTKNMIEGHMPTSADRVLLVEDVVTKGDSVIRALDEVRLTGATVVGVVALVDRLEGAGEKILGTGVPFAAFHDLTTLGLVGT